MPLLDSLDPLVALGWSDGFDRAIEAEERGRLLPARVIEEQKRFYFVESGHGPVLAQISGKLRHEATQRAALPAVGDWVLIETRPGGGARIARVLPRQTRISRRAAGLENTEQVLCTNVQTGFVVMSLDGAIDARSLERYLAMVAGGGVAPVLLLTKADLCADVGSAVAEVRRVAAGVPIVVASAPTNQGVDEVTTILEPGNTAVFLGPSGVGKSTLINRLSGLGTQAVKAVRSGDYKGRHTTTSRTLLRLPGGALVIDTPGLRSLEVWETEGGLQDAFTDLAAWSQRCRFRDCLHRHEPGCAVVAAVATGELGADRLAAFAKLQDEARVRSKNVDARARTEETRRARVSIQASRSAGARKQDP